MQTDGVSLCVLRKKNGMKTQANRRKRKRGESASERRERTYRDIAELSADELEAKGPCVLVDPRNDPLVQAALVTLSTTTFMST